MPLHSLCTYCCIFLVSPVWQFSGDTGEYSIGSMLYALVQRRADVGHRVSVYLTLGLNMTSVNTWTLCQQHLNGRYRSKHGTFIQCRINVGPELDEYLVFTGSSHKNTISLLRVRPECVLSHYISVNLCREIHVQAIEFVRFFTYSHPHQAPNRWRDSGLDVDENSSTDTPPHSNLLTTRKLILSPGADVTPTADVTRVVISHGLTTSLFRH